MSDQPHAAPPAAPAIGAAEVLVPKLLGLVESAAAIARQVHHG